jgi:hypothetical protein
VSGFAGLRLGDRCLFLVNVERVHGDHQMHFLFAKKKIGNKKPNPKKNILLFIKVETLFFCISISGEIRIGLPVKAAVKQITCI